MYLSPFLAAAIAAAAAGPREPLPLGAIARYGSARLRTGGYVFGVAFDPSGKRIAAFGQEPLVRLFDAGTGAEVERLVGHERESLRAAAFSPDGRFVATAGEDQTVRLFEAEGGRESARRAVPARSLAFSPDGRLLPAGIGDGSVRILDAHSLEEVRGFKGQRGSILSVAFSADGASVISASGLRGDDYGRESDHSLRIRDASTGEERASFAGGFAIGPLARSPDGKTLAVATAPRGRSGPSEAAVRLLDAASLKEIRSAPIAGGPVRGLAFAPGGGSLAAACHDGSVRRLDLAGLAETARRGVGAGALSGLAFSPDGKSLAAGGRRVFLLDAETLLPRLDPEGHSGPIFSVAASPDGKTVATGGDDGAVRLWEKGTGKEIRVLEGHGGRVMCLEFSPDGKFLYSGGGDRTLRRWDLAAGKADRTAGGADVEMAAIAFSPDGKTLATADLGHSILLRDPATLETKGRVGGPREANPPLVFVPGGRIATGSIHQDGGLIL